MEQSMNGPFFTSLPREMMRSLAGFPAKGRSFYLSRAAHDSPTSLCKKLFPAIDKWHDQLAGKKSVLTTTILFSLPPLPMYLYR
jgi:hypothetical protein